MRRSFVSLLAGLGLIRRRRARVNDVRRSVVQPLEERCMMHGVVAAVEDVEVDETDGPTNAVLTITLNEAPIAPVPVVYKTADLMATQPDDYQAMAGTLTFGVGVTAMSVTVPVVGDTLYEADETFYFHVEEPFHTHAHVTIRNDDPLPTLSIADAAPVKEGETGTTPARFTLSLSEATGRPITVSYSTASGTATAGEDFDEAKGALVFAPGETEKVVLVSVKGDLRQEDEETFGLNINSVDYANLTDAQATGTILAGDFQFLAVGADAGGAPQVRVLDPLNGDERFAFDAYDSSFTGGVRVATADVTGDGEKVKGTGVISIKDSRPLYF